MTDDRNTVNELRSDLLGFAALNPLSQHNSSPRATMFGTHIGQSLTIKDCQPNRLLTGMEFELGRTTFKVKMPCNGEIIKIIPKYQTSYGRGSIGYNPLDTIVFENVETRELGILDLPRFHSIHPHFGFNYKYNKANMQRVVRGNAIGKGTVLADSPDVNEDGIHCLGTMAAVAFMSMPGIIEDGMIISEDFAKRLETTGFESRDATWGNDYYPLNLYGNDDEYKPFPDIGEPIRKDGLLFALRRFDPLLGPIQMTPKALRVVDFQHDELVYAVPGATVKDVTVRYNPRGPVPVTPMGMEEQTLKYHRSHLAYYQQLLDTYAEYERKLGKGNVRVTPKFHQRLIEARNYRPDNAKSKAKLIYQLTPIDEWRVDVHFEYPVIPTDAFKLTGLHGDKGVK